MKKWGCLILGGLFIWGIVFGVTYFCTINVESSRFLAFGVLITYVLFIGLFLREERYYRMLWFEVKRG